MVMVVLFGMACSVKAQKMYTAEDVNSDLLKNIFENAYMDVLESQESFIKVKDIFTAYIDIDAQGRYISISSTYPLSDSTTEKDALELMNLLNKEIIQIKSYYSESTNNISYIYYFWIEGGFTDRSLVSAFKLYNQAIKLSISKDTKKLIK